MNKFKIMVLLLLLVMMSGCHCYVSNEEIKWAYKVCENNGGLNTITVYHRESPDAFCNNGAKFISTPEIFE